MNKDVIIIDYEAGNIKSIQFALDRLGCKSYLSDNIKDIESAERVIFPGVGHAESAMNKLKSKELNLIIPSLKQPVLGICLGMQLMCNFTEEGQTKGLGIFDVEVLKFNIKAKVPHIGWNCIKNLKNPIFDGIKDNTFMYFVHSFYATENKNSICDTQYVINFCSAINVNNFYGVQFHPEKSGKSGEKILKNFLNISI